MSAGRSGLQVLTLNVGLLRVAVAGRVVVGVPHLEPRLAALGPALAAGGADVLCLQEAFAVAHRDRLVAALRATHPYVARHDASGRRLLTHGLLVLSRYALSATAFTPFRAVPLAHRPFVRQGVLAATVDAPGLGPVRVLDAHTTAGGWGGPESPGTERVRGAQLDELHRLASASPGPVLVCGDLNAGPQASPANYRSLVGRGYLDPLAGSADVTWDPTNPLNREGPFASSPPQRVDHVLLPPATARVLAVRSARVVHREPVVPVAGGAVTLSDHAGVLVEVTSRS